MAQVFDQVHVTGDVATHRAKRLGEGAHEDINLLRIDSGVLADTATVSSEGADAVSFIDVQVALRQSITAVG